MAYVLKTHEEGESEVSVDLEEEADDALSREASPSLVTTSLTE